MDLLKEGYTLRGALRNYNYADALVNGAYRDFRGRVQLVIVSDMTADGAFDEAVKGESHLLGIGGTSRTQRSLSSVHEALLVFQPSNERAFQFSPVIAVQVISSIFIESLKINVYVMRAPGL